jgi:hypothetical protein
MTWRTARARRNFSLTMSKAEEAKLPRRGTTPSGAYDGDGHVIVRHPNTEVVKKALSMIVSKIRVELG